MAWIAVIGFIVGIIAILFLVALVHKNNCDICGIAFGDRSQQYVWALKGERQVICARCNRKLENRISSEKFDAFFYEGNDTKISEPQHVRRNISSRVKREVWQRDHGKCVECGSKEMLEYDHIIPLSKGGANTVRNIQLLCEKCNRSKSAKIQ